jgi:hypothetical protein
VSTTTISQHWDNQPGQRTWHVTLAVSGDDLSGDEIAAIEPVAAAIETYAALLTQNDTDHDG